MEPSMNPYLDFAGVSIVLSIFVVLFCSLRFRHGSQLFSGDRSQPHHSGLRYP
jgi:hypothetical protein